MASANVQWIGGKRFVGIDSSNHSVVLSTADEGVGMKPSELLLVALASCSAVDVVEIMAKKHQPLASLNVEIKGEQEVDPPGLTTKYMLNISPAEKPSSKTTLPRPFIYPRINIVRWQPRLKARPN